MECRAGRLTVLPSCHRYLSVSLAGLGFGAESPRAAIVGSHPRHEIATWILFPALNGRRWQLLMPAGLLAAAWASFLLPPHPSTPAL